MLLLLALHLALAVLAPVVGRRLGGRVLLLVGIAPLATTVWLAVHAPAAVAGAPLEERLAWVPGLGLDLVLRLDAFAVLMVALVSGIGTLVCVYASRYLAGRDDCGRLAGALVGFAGAMLGLVLADNLFAIFVCWELTAVTSYLLIGVDDRTPAARGAAQQALLVTGAGGMALLGGAVLLQREAGTASLSGLLAAPPEGALVEAALVLLVLAAFTKSAQVPFHSWLTGAMVAPTPISAYLHSATLVKAGVYLVARLAPVFAASAVWRPLVLGFGVLTMLVGGWRALQQDDLKLLLAYSTVSQLGFLVVLLGLGTAEATRAGVVLLVAHGAAKGALFLVTGSVDRAAGTRDLRRLDGLGRALPAVAAVAAVAAASLAGLPPLLGFVGKEAAFEALLHDRSPVLLAAVVAGSCLTVAYCARFLWGAFMHKRAAELAADAVSEAQARPRWALLGPAAVLAGVAAVTGAAVGPLGAPLVAGARALDPAVGGEPLTLWHGLNLPLALTVLTLAGGALLHRARHRVRGAGSGLLPAPGELFRAGLRGTLIASDRVTGVVQSGSLPAYLGTILLTVLVLPGSALLWQAPWPESIRLFDRPLQVGLAVLIAVGAVAVTLIRRRFAAVVTLGGVGYGVAGLFVVHGAPDLALTQLLIETLTVVVFFLVLRHLPRPFVRRRLAFSRGPRVLLAVGVGVFAAAATLIAAAARTADPVSLAHVDRALPEGQGRNVVNVILVDFRGWDTLMEIVVLTVAALGVIGLVRAARRDRRRAERAGTGPAPAPAFRRSVVLETGLGVTVRTLVLFALYLLLAGHNAPGGGFIGGLVVGASLVLLYVGRGADHLPLPRVLVPERLLGTGVVVAAGTGVGGWLWGDGFLASGSADLVLPLFGEVKLLTTLVFDVGVFLVVVGLVLALLGSLGREEVVPA